MGQPRVSESNDKIAVAVRLVEELTRELAGCSSTADLFESAFRTLYGTTPFDVAAGVMVEQTIDLYLAGRPATRSLADDKLFTTIRNVVETVVPPPFGGSDVVVKSERYELPPLTGAGDPMAHAIHVPLLLKNRPAGVLVLCRSDSFAEADRLLLSLFSSLLSTLHDSMQARRRIRALAETDDLTGIANRRYFRRQLPQEIERARTYRLPLALLMIDVDDFKQINDTFGHVVGDVVLSELCGMMRESLRTPDFIARYGGDEFAVILSHTDLAGAAGVAARILSQLREVTIEIDAEHAISCSVSIGVAELKPDDTSGRDLIRRADDRLYEAKRQGKNRFVC